MDFGLQVGTIFGGFLVDFLVLLGSWSNLGQDGAQSRPREPPGSILADFGPQLGGFGAQLAGFWLDFGPILSDC